MTCKFNLKKCILDYYRVPHQFIQINGLYISIVEIHFYLPIEFITKKGTNNLQKQLFKIEGFFTFSL